MKTKTYTIKVGEVFTKQKAKELKEYLELIDKDYYQTQKELRDCLICVRDVAKAVSPKKAR